MQIKQLHLKKTPKQPVNMLILIFHVKNSIVYIVAFLHD